MAVLFTQGRVITRYLRLVLWPHPLALAYDWPQVTPMTVGLPYFVLVAALFGATAWGLYRRLPIAFAGACVFLLLAPSSSLVPLPTEIAAERRMYLPSAFLIAALVVLAWKGLARLVGGPNLPRVRLAAASVVAVALAIATRDRLADYRTTLAIWEDAARKSPQHSTVRANYGRELVVAGRPAEAVPHLRASIAMREDNAVPHYLLGFAFLSSGDAAAAQPPCARHCASGRTWPTRALPWGGPWPHRRDWAGAAHEFEELLRSRPTSPTRASSWPVRATTRPAR